MKLAVKTAIVTFLVDQITKAIVLYPLDLDTRGEIDVLPPWVGLRMAWNQGINFGLFANSADAVRWVLIAVALAISTWVWLWVRREPHSVIVHLSAGLLIGGAIGNVIDRVLYGAVADFLNFSTPWFDNPYAFNVADIAIFAGAIGLVLFTGRERSA